MVFILYLHIYAIHILNIQNAYKNNERKWNEKLMSHQPQLFWKCLWRPPTSGLHYTTVDATSKRLLLPFSLPTLLTVVLMVKITVVGQSRFADVDFFSSLSIFATTTNYNQPPPIIIFSLLLLYRYATKVKQKNIIKLYMYMYYV